MKYNFDDQEKLASNLTRPNLSTANSTSPTIRKPEKLPFAATVPGIAVNTVRGLPSAAVKVGKSILRESARSIASSGVTLAKPLGGEEELSSESFKSNYGQALFETVFGFKPVKSLEDRIADAEISIKFSPTARKIGIDKFALPLAFGGIIGEASLDLTGLGSSKTLPKQLLKETSVEGVTKILKGADPEVVKMFAPRFAKANTPEQVNATFELFKSAIGTKTLAKKGAEEAIKPVKNIASEDLFEMRDFTDYVNGAYKPKNTVQLEVDARRIAERYGINPELPNNKLSAKFGQVLDENMTMASKATDRSLRGESGKFAGSRQVTKTPTEAFGVVAGVEQDEEGNLSFNPTKAAFGVAGFAGFTRGKKLFNAQEREMLRVNLETARQWLETHPGKNLAKFANRNGEIPEALGGSITARGTKIGKFGRMGDDIAKTNGFEDSESARVAYQDYLKGKERVALMEEQYKLARQQVRDEAMNGIKKPESAKDFAGRMEKQFERPVVLTAREKRIVDSGVTSALELKKGLKSPQLTPGEARSLEIQAEIARNIAKGEDVPMGASLPKIIKETVTPVEKKVNIIDTYLRTPNRVMEKIGFGKEAKELRTASDAYWKELPQNIDKIKEWSKQVPAESNKRIFKWLDGQAIDLRPEEMKVAKEVKTWLQGWAERLKLQNDNKISNYITHIFDKSSQKEFDEELAKLIADKIPGSVYDPFTLKRLGKRGYKEDTWLALDAYVKRGTRKVHFDPVLEKIQSKAGSALDVSNIEKSQWQYINKYVNNINMRPSDLDESIDNVVKGVFGNRFGIRPVTQTTALLRRMTYRGMLGLNPGSALRNLSQGVNTYATLGEKYTTIGYASLLKNGATKELEREGILNAGFIQDKKLSATGRAMEKLDKGLFYLFDKAEKINRGAAYFGAKSKALQSGKTEAQAIEYAKDIVRKTQFVFDTVDTPVGMGSDIAKTLTQFQTYTTKQIEFLTEMAKDKNFVGLLRYGIAGLIFVNTIGKAFGMEPKELLPIYRIGTPPSLKLPVEIGKAAVDAPNKYGKDRTLGQKVSDIGKATVGLIPGGNQIRKTIQGKGAVNEGAVKDKSGRVQFEAGGSTWADVQAYLFGKYASPEAKEYFDKRDKPSSKSTSKSGAPKKKKKYSF